jgi:hypothetical protein
MLNRFSDWLRAGRSGFDFRQERDMYLFSATSTPALWLTQPPTQWIQGNISTGVKRQEREADHSPPSSTDVNKVGAIVPLPNKPSWCCA